VHRAIAEHGALIPPLPRDRDGGPPFLCSLTSLATSVASVAETSRLIGVCRGNRWKNKF
jgi:hypothetical protein